ncbi:MAG: replication-associated recombination protein A, partial [Oscillospiraceae bacterium]
MSSPLADRIRPESFEEVIGQTHLLGENKPLKRIIESGLIPNMIFYGSSGIGKTTVARIIAKQTNMKLFKLNGTNCSISDIKDIVEQINTISAYNGILLYLDEIQYLNKKQQQSLLEYIEDGSITLIASTTENPYFYIYNAILSRCTVFEFKKVEPIEIQKALERAFCILSKESGMQIDIEDGVLEHISLACGGDVRKSLNSAELCFFSAGVKEDKKLITMELAQQLSQKSSMQYDRDGDNHYNILSAFQKSIRGSDENAALHYLARLLEAGDLISACRRLLVIACEDIGLAYPQAIPVVKACVDMATQLGLPEARIPLADAVILLCTSPKSNSGITAIDMAMADVKAGLGGNIPDSLQDGHYQGAKKLGKSIGYKYPHTYKNHYVKQQYLPDELKDRVYYSFSENKIEQ